jgi:hypothetical protein
MHSLVIPLAYAALLFARVVAFAEPLFFDCHGTYEHTPADEKPEYHHKPMDWTA